MLRATCFALAVLTVPVLAGEVACADESPVTATAAFEYYAGPNAQETRSAKAEVEASIHRITSSVSVGRISDSSAGAGLDLGAGLGVPMSLHTRLKFEAERAEGDSGYVAWTVNAGPSFELLHGRTLTFKYVRVEDNESTVTNGVSAELESPVIPDKLSASGSLAYGAIKTESIGGLEASAGLSWAPVDHVEIEGDAGYTGTGISLSNPLSPKHVGNGNGHGKHQSQGAPTASSSEDSPGMTADLAVRFSFP